MNIFGYESPNTTNWPSPKKLHVNRFAEFTEFRVTDKSGQTVSINVPNKHAEILGGVLAPQPPAETAENPS